MDNTGPATKTDTIINELSYRIEHTRKRRREKTLRVLLETAKKYCARTRKLLGVLRKEMIASEMSANMYLRASQDWKLGVESFLKEEASSSHQIYLSPDIALIEVLF